MVNLDVWFETCLFLFGIRGVCCFGFGVGLLV